MTRVLPRALQDSITHKVRERDQAKLERSVAGSDAFGATPSGRDEAKPHGSLAGLPWSTRARHIANDAARFAPSLAQTRSGAIAAVKFAGLALPFGFAGVLIGATNHYISFGPRAVLGNESLGDAHALATMGLALGLVDAGLVAAKQYELAGALAAGIGAGTAANAVTLLYGTMLSGAIALAAGESANVWRWYMREPTNHGGFWPIFRAVSPALHGLATGAAGVGGAIAAYAELRPKPVADASASV